MVLLECCILVPPLRQGRAHEPLPQPKLRCSIYSAAPKQTTRPRVASRPINNALGAAEVLTARRRGAECP